MRRLLAVIIMIVLSRGALARAVELRSELDAGR